MSVACKQRVPASKVIKEFCGIVSLKILKIPDGWIGDLFISYLKRKAKIKDTGKILPGHGGIFDRFDGLMFVAILAFIFYIL